MIDRIRADKRFEEYYSLLNEWNQKINLTTVIEKNEVYERHFLDSVLPCDLIPANSRVLDIGSGAGFPAIPLKIIRPDLSVIMLDSVNKKVSFLQTVIDKLGLKGIKAIHIRVEDYTDRAFDVVTARAVAPLNILLEYSIPFLKTGGTVIAYKSSGYQNELISATNAFTTLNASLHSIVEKPLNTETLRSFIIIEKKGSCPDIYPRKQNKPRLQPL